MIAGIIAGITWAIETIILGIALAMTPFVSTEQAVILAPFVSTFLHDAFSAIWSCIFNCYRGKFPAVVNALRTKSGKYVMLAAIIGGPVGMTGYVLSVAYKADISRCGGVYINAVSFKYVKKFRVGGVFVAAGYNGIFWRYKGNEILAVFLQNAVMRYFYYIIGTV